MNSDHDETGLADLGHAIRQAWNTGDGLPESRDALLESLALRVAFLLKHDYARLLSGLYLLDISEDRFAQAQTASTNTGKARAVAELILDREAEKLESRKQYRKDRSVDVPARPVDPDRLEG